MAADGHYNAAVVSILFLTFFYSPSSLWADRHQTLPHVRWWLSFIFGYV